MEIDLAPEQEVMLQGQVLDDCTIPFYEEKFHEWALIKCSPSVLQELDELLQGVENYSFYRTGEENYHQAIAYMEKEGYTFTKECQCPQVDVAALVQRADEAEMKLFELERRFEQFAELVEELVHLFYQRFTQWHFDFFAMWNICGGHIDTVKSIVKHFQRLHNDQEYFHTRFRGAFERAGLKRPRKNDDLEF